MKKKITVLALCAMLLALRPPANAQQPSKIFRIAFLAPTSPADFSNPVEAYRQGLRDLGYVEGKNILIEYRYAERKLDRLPELAAELVRLKVDAFVVGGAAAATAAKQASGTIPIVVGAAGDLVGAGLVTSLAKPGGNITGSIAIAPDLSGKRLELLKEVVPKVSRVAVLWDSSPGQSDEVSATETAARSLGVKVEAVEVQDPKEFESAYSAMIKQQAAAVIIIQSSFSLGHRRQLADLAEKHRLPSMCEQKEW